MGKLQQKLYALSNKYRTKGIIKSRYNLKSTVEEITQHPDVPASSDDILSLNDMNEDYHWLKKNLTPEQTVLEKWDKTYQLRKIHYKNTNCNMLEEWPILAQKIGTTLVSLLNYFKF